MLANNVFYILLSQIYFEKKNKQISDILKKNVLLQKSDFEIVSIDSSPKVVVMIFRILHDYVRSY